MQKFKTMGLAFLSWMFFVVLCIAMLLVTDIMFNKTTTFFDRYKDFEYETNYGVVTNEEI